MFLLVNTYAGGGGAEIKWERIKNAINKRFNDLKIFKIDMSSNSNSFIQDAISKNEKDFIIAGGDGTINQFINKLIDNVDKNDIKGIRIGAIGIGSSNDFHKPIQYENLINEIPAKIDFNSCELRDVCLIKYKSESEIQHKYFLLNASIGVTAKANNLFNNLVSSKICVRILLKSARKFFENLRENSAIICEKFSPENFVMYREKTYFNSLANILH